MKIIWIISFLIPLTLFATEWHVDKTRKNEAKYLSSVSVLTFEGVTSSIDGYVYWEQGEFKDALPRLYFEVDLPTLDSGIGKRDSDMREVLQTDRWRYATYEGNFVEIKETGEPGVFDVVLSGNFFVNGSEREIEVKGTVIIKGNDIRVTADFTFELKDYGIEAPSLLAFVKVSESIDISLDFYMKPVKP